MDSQSKCPSEVNYWALEKDIVLAKVLFGILKHLERGNMDFPDFPNIRDSNTLMGWLCMVDDWAHDLVSGHKHEYKTITLIHGERNEDYPDGCPFGYLVYDKCKICGEWRYNWRIEDYLSK